MKNSSRDQISYNGVQEGVLKGSLIVCPPLQYIMHCVSIGAEELLLYRVGDEDSARKATFTTLHMTKGVSRLRT
jgi:hypothetical protein